MLNFSLSPSEVYKLEKLQKVLEEIGLKEYQSPPSENLTKTFTDSKSLLEEQESRQKKQIKLCSYFG